MARNYTEVRDRIDSSRISVDPNSLNRNFTDNQAQSVRRTLQLNVQARFVAANAGNNPHSMLAAFRK